MKYVIYIMFLFQLPIFGQEFLISNIYTVLFTANPHTSQIYFKDYYSLNDYYVADLRTMNVNTSGFSCLPVFSYKTNKMIYRENDKLHLVNSDQNTDKIFTISDSLNYSEYFNPFSPNGNYAFLYKFIYSFQDSSLHPIIMDDYNVDYKWISDTTFIATEWNNSLGIRFLVEYSTNSARRDTFYYFNPDMDGFGWDYDIKRDKIYYSTIRSAVEGTITDLRVYDRHTKTDTILFEYPKDHNPSCSVYYPGGRISRIKFSGDYEKMSFIFNYLLDISAADIYTFWPDSNKISKIKNECMSFGGINYFDWANADTLVYDIPYWNLWGINVPHITSIKNENGPATPINYTLSQNYPNPFNPSTTINYSLPKSGNVKLTVYNSIGSKVETIVNEYKPAGNYSVQFNASILASGIYLYRLESGYYSAAKKFILIK